MRKITEMVILQITKNIRPECMRCQVCILPPCFDRFYLFEYITNFSAHLVIFVLFFQGNPHCPVNSFPKYTAKLYRSNPNLWQRSKIAVSETKSVWYDNAPLDRNTIAAMMSNISKDAELSVTYTNHCIRATCITNLDSKGIDTRHIVGISGHKNTYRIMSNSSRLSEEKRFEIFKTLCESSL